MNSIIKLTDFGQILCGPETSEKLYNKIQELLNNDSEIDIDFSDIKGMAVSFATDVFGRLYTELGFQKFAEKLKFKNTVKDHQLTIRWGIEYAIETKVKELKAAT